MAAVDILLENHFHTRQSEQTSLSPNNPKIRNGNSVFVIGRPPGHHAGPRGCVPSSTYWKAPGMTSSGFCLLNTVAVAAVSETILFLYLIFGVFDFQCNCA